MFPKVFSVLYHEQQPYAQRKTNTTIIASMKINIPKMGGWSKQKVNYG